MLILLSRLVSHLAVAVYLQDFSNRKIYSIIQLKLEATYFFGLGEIQDVFGMFTF